jgi:hypothetical protein
MIPLILYNINKANRPYRTNKTDSLLSQKHMGPSIIKLIILANSAHFASHDPEFYIIFYKNW